jgi:hypothetical protein
MKTTEYKQTGTRTEEYTVIIPAEYDDEGMVITEEHEEVHTREVPVMGLVYRDMTAEELAEIEQMQSEVPEPEATAEDRIEAQVMYTAVMTDTLLESEGNENV